MAHGTPDWWGTEPSTTIHKVSDLGELAVRLGSIVTFDRRGDVMWLSSLENGLGEFITGLGGNDGEVVLSTATAQRGAYSCKLTASSDVLKSAMLMKSVAYPALSQVGGEFAFTWEAGVDYVLHVIQFWDGADLFYFAIQYDESNGKINYWSSGGAWVEIDDLPAWATNIYVFHVSKLVVDLDAKEYVRLIIDNTGYPLAGIAGHESEAITFPRLELMSEVYGPGTTNPSIYVDDMILTQNEP